MDDARVEAWIALLDAGVSFSILSRLVDAFGGPVQALDASDDAWAFHADVRTTTARRLRDAQRDDARRRLQLRAFHDHGMRLLDRDDVDFPRLLREAPDAPPALFLRGELRPGDNLAVALVGPRLATPYGLEMARRLARDLAPVVTVASGLAHGVDSTAHAATLDAGGRTIGCAACGLDQDYPQGGGELRDAITRSGALLSAWPPLTKPATHQFPQRNAILAGLSLGVVVVEASNKSGALVTARAAADANREVFAVPGDATRRNSAGANQLLREGAALATCAGDIIEELAPRLTAELAALLATRQEAAAAAALPPPVDLTDAEAAVLAVLAHDATPYDDLASAFGSRGMALGELATALLGLELKGLARAQPGKVYAATAAGLAAAG